MGSEGGAGAASGRRRLVSREIRLGTAILAIFGSVAARRRHRVASPAVHSGVGEPLLVLNVAPLL